VPPPMPTVKPTQRPTDDTVADRVLRLASLVMATLPLAILAVLVLVMLASGSRALIYSGVNLLTGRIFTFGHLYGGTPTVQNGIAAPHNASYGGATLILGTLLTSAIALALAIPVALGAALLVTERLPYRLQSPVSLIGDLLAGIPSVVYGVWGVTILGPLAARSLYPWLAHWLGFIPFFRGPVGAGEGLLTASLVLAVMVVPIIASTTRELLRRVPILHKEGGLALGMTRLEVVRAIIWPFVRNGVLGASLLGWARALGETMAVLLISGNALNVFPGNIYDPIGTIAATIAALLDGALTDGTGMAVSALGALGLVLLLITLATNLGGRLIVRRMAGGGVLPVGRGF
jgi:phosphate transport system permease protein